MIKLPELASCIFASLSLSTLVSCSNPIATKTTTSSSDASVAATAKSEASPTNSVTATPVAQVAQATGDLLDAAQKDKLRELSVPIIVPTYLPAGFRVIKLEAGREELRSGSYAYYSILYKGEDDACFDISLNTDPAMLTSRMPRRFMQIPISNKDVTIIYGNVEDKPITMGRFSVPSGSPTSAYMLRTGGWMPSSQEGRNIRCNSISDAEYDKVLQALKVLDFGENTSTNNAINQSAIASNPSNSDNLLSAEQKNQLSQLGIDVILPTYLPAGTKLGSFKAYKKQTSQAADYSFYNIQYIGTDNTCLEAGSGYQSMWQKNPSKMQIDTKVGVVEVSSGTHSRSGTLQHWGWIRKNAEGQSLITGGLSTNGKPCNPINFEEYNKVLQSLDVVNTKQ
ncbi:hypothetical protein [Pseudanabaena sp. Chao 1811]|uniref:hypothetical protein n=1 Tax=Pseudanabaena sp. Chao 1811 TaxID=2963092 RepID=UPI0022F3E0F8|nr:hypothetical protein [Pseudanabaena sp. Chao 1811]